WKGWAILLRQKQKKLIMLPSETMIWQPEFTDKTLSRKPGAVQIEEVRSSSTNKEPSDAQARHIQKELKQVTNERDILKKCGVLRKTVRLRYLSMTISGAGLFS
ncbi:hypothetical protein MQC29_24805, partial [Escherichia coli]|nr:hypothetical protein [Escherichia coli]